MLIVVNTFAVYGVVWSSINAVPAEYVEVARVCGVTPAVVYWYIKIPLALRNALGPLTSSQVYVLHLSIFGSLISVDEIFRVSQRINAVVYRPVEVYTGLAVLFVIVCVPLNILAARLAGLASGETASR